MTARCADKSKQTATHATPPSKITWLSVDSIQPDVMDVGVRSFAQLASKIFNPCGHDPPRSQTDRQTDRRHYSALHGKKTKNTKRRPSRSHSAWTRFHSLCLLLCWPCPIAVSTNNWSMVSVCLSVLRCSVMHSWWLALITYCPRRVFHSSGAGCPGTASVNIGPSVQRPTHFICAIAWSWCIIINLWAKITRSTFCQLARLWHTLIISCSTPDIKLFNKPLVCADGVCDWFTRLCTWSAECVVGHKLQTCVMHSFTSLAITVRWRVLYSAWSKQ